MSLTQRKRFWKSAAPSKSAGGFGISLDGKPVMTPAGAPLILPTQGLAAAVALEWQGIEGEIRPETMPLTRAANAAIDKVAAETTAVIEMLADYGATDLLCYRAEGPQALVRRQADAWDPWLHWGAETLDAPLSCAAGVMHVVQPADSLARLRQAVAAHSPFELTALHDLVTLSGSLILALAVSRAALTPADAWHASLVDETWQQEQWGRDAEAAARTEARRAAFETAATLLRLVREG